MEYWVKELRRLTKEKAAGRKDGLTFRLEVHDIKKRLLTLVKQDALTIEAYRDILKRGLEAQADD